MSVVDKLRGCNGTTKYMQKFDIGEPARKTHRAWDEHFNNIILKFGKDEGIKFQPNNNSGYKGQFSPLVDNGWNVQDHFPAFKKWMYANYKPKR
jgi:hypothetical protein